MAASFPPVASKDTLYSSNLRLLKHRRITFTQGASVQMHAEDPEKRLALMTRLVMLNVCRDWHWRRPTSRERRNLRPSQVRGWPGTRRRRGTSDAPRPGNLRRRSVEGSATERAKEPPGQLSRGTSDAPKLRNLRRTEWRRICDWAEDPSLRLAEALDRRHA